MYQVTRLAMLLGVVAVLFLAAVACNGDKGADRLADVRSRGKVECATQTDIPGFGYLDEDGRIVGFDVDLCRAVAAAIFGNSEALNIRHIAYAEREDLLRSGEVDMVSRTTTWTSGREAQWGNFTVTMFYDGQGFMVHRGLGFDSVDDLDGKTVCVIAGTGTEGNLEDYFRQNSMELETFRHQDATVTYSAYERGECDAATIDKSQLAAVRSGFDDPSAHVILPDTISKEPLAPMTPWGDERWATLVRTVMYVLINAEELGVTQANVAAMTGSDDIAVRRMLGVEGSFGQAELGLEQDFAVAVIQAVGNYGEIYDRYLGPQGDVFTLPRGINNLWSSGGLIYAPPLR